MKTINQTLFKKDILKKGVFQQLIVCPYSGEQHSVYNRVVVLSDQVTEPCYYTYRKRKMALLLPHKSDVRATIQENIEEISSFTGVMATFFTCYDLDYQTKLCSISAKIGSFMSRFFCLQKPPNFSFK